MGENMQIVFPWGHKLYIYAYKCGKYAEILLYIRVSTWKVYTTNNVNTHVMPEWQIPFQTGFWGQSYPLFEDEGIKSKKLSFSNPFFLNK